MLNSTWAVNDGKITITETAQGSDLFPDTRTPRRGGVGDTPTRRALRGTMRAHDYFNSMLTGKRFVTSSFRTNNLGSPSSDHAAGRAYDLVGQNLGQYQSMVNASGGFAEFHGVASNRHLHVVPPMGDTYGSRRNSVSQGTATVGQSVTVNVYAAPGQSETSIAKHVVAAIEERERRARERR